jgi:hypothetical protein
MSQSALAQYLGSFAETALKHATDSDVEFSTVSNGVQARISVATRGKLVQVARYTMLAHIECAVHPASMGEFDAARLAEEIRAARHVQYRVT